jgi:CHAT domain-containing protein
MIYYFMDDDKQAVRHLEVVEELREDLVFDYQPFEANFIRRVALMYEALSDYAQALDYQEDALAIYSVMEDYAGQAATWEAIGALYETQAKIAPALDAYRHAIEFSERLHSSAKIEEFKIAMAEQSADVYARAICLAMRLGQSRLAFHLAERGRARTFLDQIGNVRVDPGATDDPDLIAQEQALLAEIRGLEAVLSGRSSFETLNFDGTRGGVPPLSPEKYNEVRSRLDEAYHEYERLLAQIKLSNPAYAALRVVDASTLITVQQTLPAGTTLVEYYVVSPTQTLAFVVTPDTLHTVPLSLTYQSVITELEAFDAETRASLAGVPDSMQTLYDWLFAPVRSHIHTQAVLIAPHQQLHYLPFGALHDGERYLMEDYTIGYLPSASVLRYLNAKAQGHKDEKEILVLGNRDNDAGTPLPAAEREAQAVADLFGVPAYLNAEATEARLWDQANGVHYVHIAAHGSFNPTAPQFSRLYLAPSEAASDTVTNTLSTSHIDGLLETREVWNLPLADADLVTLSACETQLGDLSAGDELVGLSRAFIYAGTPSLVASLWKVEDAATEYLMTRFYGYLKDGVGKAEALRQAQLDTMAQEEWQSPFFWAAFTLIGDMGALGHMPPERQVQSMPTTTSAPADDKKQGGLGGFCPAMALPLAMVAVGLWQRRRR